LIRVKVIKAGNKSRRGGTWYQVLYRYVIIVGGGGRRRREKKRRRK
jgi:hypothetical protein